MLNKKLFLCLLFSGLLTFVQAQDAREILRKTAESCASIRSGSYEMTKRMKFIGDNDTVVSDLRGHFKRSGSDTNFHAFFVSRLYVDDRPTTEALYDGNQLITLHHKDSSAIIYSPEYWAATIRDTRSRYALYRPFTYDKTCLPSDSALSDQRNIYRLVGEETIYSEPCYRILFREFQIPDTDPRATQIATVEYEYWISKASHLPLQYSQTFTMLMGRDTMTQFELYSVRKYNLNLPFDERLIDIKSVTELYRVRNFIPSKKKTTTIPLDTLAPDWTLISLDQDTVRLKDLKGQLVLVDFFYKSCYPCMLALPSLQTLHEKYGSRGLKVIGIDPVDKQADVLKPFLEKRDVTYTILLSDMLIPQDYQVTGYPTLFLIDKTGKVIYVQAGYSKDMETRLEKLILENL